MHLLRKSTVEHFPFLLTNMDICKRVLLKEIKNILDNAHHSQNRDVHRKKKCDRNVVPLLTLTFEKSNTNIGNNSAEDNERN